MKINGMHIPDSEGIAPPYRLASFEGKIYIWERADDVPRRDESSHPYRPMGAPFPTWRAALETLRDLNRHERYNRRKKNTD